MPASRKGNRVSISLPYSPSRAVYLSPFSGHGAARCTPGRCGKTNHPSARTRQVTEVSYSVSGRRVGYARAAWHGVRHGSRDAGFQ